MEKNEYFKMFEFENDYWWYRGLHELVFHYAAKHKKKSGADDTFRLFDAGCGTGRTMEILSPVGKVEGVDYMPEAVELCKKRGLENVEQGDLNTWTAPGNSFDVIVSNDVVCTSGVEDDAAVMEKFFNALKPGGVVILNHPAYKILRRRHDIAVFGKRRYRKYKTLKQMKQIGFKTVRATYRLPLLFFVMLLKKVLIESWSKAEVESDLKPLPGFINSLLLFGHRLENKMIQMGIPLPFGSSLFLVCQKPGTENGLTAGEQ